MRKIDERLRRVEERIAAIESEERDFGETKRLITIYGQDIPTYQRVWELFRESDIKMRRNTALIAVNGIATVITLIIVILGL